MRMEALRHRLDHPALLATNQQADVLALGPQPFHRGKGLTMALARLDRAYHHQYLAAFQISQNGLIRRAQPPTWPACLYVTPQVEIANVQSASSGRLVCIEPGRQLVRNCARYAD